MEENLKACKHTRSFAAESLKKALEELNLRQKYISEKQLSDTWLKHLQTNTDLFLDGWYTPPPHGIGILFGTADKKSRQNYKSLRPEEMWPKENIFLINENKLAYIYASPVDKKTGMIGDFGLSIYLGDDPKIKRHLQLCLEINQKIFDFIEPGKTFSEVYTFVMQVISSYGLTNEITSTTDPAGVNIGHTVPGSYKNWTEEEWGLLRSGDSNWENIKDMISKKRIFINASEQITFQKGMAVTLEPRLTVANDQNIPMASFHTIAIINQNGSKELLTNFEEIFRVTNMDYML